MNELIAAPIGERPDQALGSFMVASGPGRFQGGFHRRGWVYPDRNDLGL